MQVLRVFRFHKKKLSLNSSNAPIKFSSRIKAKAESWRKCNEKSKPSAYLSCSLTPCVKWKKAVLSSYIWKLLFKCVDSSIRSSFSCSVKFLEISRKVSIFLNRCIVRIKVVAVGLLWLVNVHRANNFLRFDNCSTRKVVVFSVSHYFFLESLHST